MTEISANPGRVPVDTSNQCDMFNYIERPDKENSQPKDLCTSNNDDNFFPLVQKNEETFEDFSGMCNFILNLNY